MKAQMNTLCGSERKHTFQKHVWEKKSPKHNNFWVIAHVYSKFKRIIELVFRRKWNELEIKNQGIPRAC